MLSQIYQRPCRRLAALCTFVGILAGCPRRFDPEAAPKLPPSAPVAAIADCEALFTSKAFKRADLCFAHLGKGDDITLFRGRIAARVGAHDKAIQLLEPLVRSTDSAEARRHARYHLGLALLAVGQWEKARAALSALEIPAEGATLSLLIAQAEIARHLDPPGAANGLLIRVYKRSERATERAWARAMLRLPIQKMDRSAAERAFSQSPRGGILRALYAEHLIGLARTRGDDGVARATLKSAAAAIATHLPHLRPKPTAEKGVTPKTIVIALPLHGRMAKVGQLALEAALEASGALNRPQRPGRQKSATRIAIYDSADGSTGLSRRYRRETVVGIMGGIQGSMAQQLARWARGRNVPFFTISQHRGYGQSVMPVAQARARALAREAITHGAHRILVIHPSTRYGKMMSNAFSRAFVGPGRRVSQRLHYRAGTRSFAPLAKRLVPKSFDGVFVPDTAGRLSLIVAALAGTGIRMVGTAKRAKNERLLVATADGLRQADVDRSNIMGGIIAPGFFAPAELPDRHVGASLRTYQAAFGRLPSILEALAADAMRALQARVGGSASGGAIRGWTGMMRFDANGGRTDAARLYRWARGALTPLVPTAAAAQ